jgi:Chaperone of endosialidase
MLNFLATEAWSTSANGSSFRFYSTPATTTSQAVTMQLGSGTTSAAGGLVLGNPTGGDKGAGTVNATTVYAAGVALSSDARMKRDIAPLTIDALGLIAAIEPKSFKHLPPPLPEPGADGMLPAMPPAEWFERTWWGFLADEVDSAIAGAGHQWDGMVTDAEGNQALSYNDLIPVLWRAVQELQQQIAQLRGDAAALGGR